VDDLLERTDLPRFLLGDNAHRPRGATTPRLLRKANERGLPVLPGTDPLPLAGEHERAGSFGGVTRRAGARSEPGTVVRALLDGDLHLDTRGSRIGWARFVRTQTALRLRRRNP
jgi:hypothetical protein